MFFNKGIRDMAGLSLRAGSWPKQAACPSSAIYFRFSSLLLLKRMLAEINKVQ